MRRRASPQSKNAVPPVGDEDIGVVQVVVLQRCRDPGGSQAAAQLAVATRSSFSRSRSSASGRRAGRRSGLVVVEQVARQFGSRSGRRSGTPRATMSVGVRHQVDLQPRVVAPASPPTRPARRCPAGVRSVSPPSGSSISRRPGAPPAVRARGRAPTPPAPPASAGSWAEPGPTALSHTSRRGRAAGTPWTRPARAAAPAPGRLSSRARPAGRSPSPGPPTARPGRSRWRRRSYSPGDAMRPAPSGARDFRPRQAPDRHRRPRPAGSAPAGARSATRPGRRRAARSASTA